MNRTVHILRMIIALILFVIALELCARLDDYVMFRASILGVYSSENLYENDQLGKRGKPFARYRKWQLNELGYRGPHLNNDCVHLVTFGASETFGLYESDDKDYPRQLERELNNRAGKPLYQVMNVAYPGQTLPTATLRVPEIVAKVHPQIALIYASPAFYIDAPENSHTFARAVNQPVFEFRITDRLHNLAKSVLPEAVQTKLRTWEIQRSIGHRPAIDRLPEEAISRFRDDLTKMITTLHASGVRPVVITHATIFGVVPKNPDHAMLTAWRKFYPQLKEDGFLDLEERTNEAMREVARQQQVTLVDIAREVPPGATYFADFVHFTDVGAAVMAKRLADGIEPLLLQLSDPRYVNTARARPNHSRGNVVTQ